MITGEIKNLLIKIYNREPTLNIMIFFQINNLMINFGNLEKRNKNKNKSKIISQKQIIRIRTYTK